jgi:hypothetical protein
LIKVLDLETQELKTGVTVLTTKVFVTSQGTMYEYDLKNFELPMIGCKTDLTASQKTEMLYSAVESSILVITNISIQKVITHIDLSYDFVLNLSQILSIVLYDDFSDIYNAESIKDFYQNPSFWTTL